MRAGRGSSPGMRSPAMRVPIQCTGVAEGECLNEVSTPVRRRVFLHVWSVNLKFLPPWLFQSRGVAVALLLCHVALLGVFATYR